MKALKSLESINVPEPVIQLMVEPQNLKLTKTMGIALFKMVEEDPTFLALKHTLKLETLISGIGVNFTLTSVDRMRREFKVEANVGAPQVSYRETFRALLHKHADSSNVSLVVKVNCDLYGLNTPQTKKVRFSNSKAIVGFVVPREFIPQRLKGLVESMANGVLAGYPMVDVKAKLYDGSYHDVSTHLKLPSRLRLHFPLKKLLNQHNQLLLPMMLVTITVLQKNLGYVMWVT